LDDCIDRASIIVIAVGTPPSSDGSHDLSAVQAVVKNLSGLISSYKTIVTKSTVPPGTNDWIEQTLLDNGVDHQLFDIVSNPEFLREGTAIQDSLLPDRIVIGLKRREPLDVMQELYQNLNAPYLVTGFAEAEMIKYASNAFLATKISFINEISRICDVCGADIVEVAMGLGMDHRIGSHFLRAGLGYGGSCFPKDLNALIHTALSRQIEPSVLQAVQKVNETQIDVYMQKLITALEGDPPYKITVWGASFKPQTDDVRSSQSVRLLQRLSETGYNVHAYDPMVRPALPTVTWHHQMYDSVQDADALVIATEWDAFVQADWKLVSNLMKGRLLLDGRNCVNKHTVEACGIRYVGVGRT
jgi:UDPglucose 6-dehydrogenase